MHRLKGYFVVAAIGVALLAAAPMSHAEALIGLTGQNALVSFDSASPGTVSATVPVTGLAAGENLLAIDIRPATGQLYGLGSTSRLYAVNPVTGAATPVGSAGAFTLSGTSFGFDFNPTVDRIRVVSNLDQNLRLNPNDGTLTATDTPLAFAAGDANAGANPNVVGAAYSNNFAGAPATTLYGIDSSLRVLVTQNPPNNGTLNTVGSLGLGFSLTDPLGFDISGLTGTAYAVFNSPASSNLSQLSIVNLATGDSGGVGGIGGGVTVIDLAAAVPEPAAAVVLAFGLIALLRPHRR
jgi:hypothetical protein